jgi:hypothetical protein
VSLDATAGAIRSLVLGKDREEAGGGPAFLVRLCGELGQIALTPGRRSSLSSGSTRAASMEVAMLVMLLLPGSSGPTRC